MPLAKIDDQRLLDLLDKGLSYAEIAKDFGVQENTINQKVYRLRKRGAEIPDQRLVKRQVSDKSTDKSGDKSTEERKQVTYKLTTSLAERVGKYAELHGMTRNEVVEAAISEFLRTIKNPDGDLSTIGDRPLCPYAVHIYNIG